MPDDAPTIRVASLRAAIEDLAATHGEAYPGAALLKALSQVEQSLARPNADRAAIAKHFQSLQRRALLANPAVANLEILCVRRAWRNGVTQDNLAAIGIPSNHECQSSLKPGAYDNEIAVFRATDPQATWKTIHRPDGGGWVGNVDLHWNGDRFLYSERNGLQFNLWEMRLDGTGKRRITNAPDDVDCFDPCYMPSGKIVCASNATGQCVPCWHGVARKYVANLFTMNDDGADMRRFTFDQDHNMHPAVMESGRIVFNRWDYTGINRVFLRPLMLMNPDGTNQRALYGSNSWFPNGLYSPRQLPGQPGRLLCILSGYHGPGRTGHLVIVDTNRGSKEADGIVQRISGQGLPLDVKLLDRLTEETWPKFHASHPITDKHFLVSGWMSPEQRRFGIYLADVFDNVIPLYEIEGQALLEPIPVLKRPTPPMIAEQVAPRRDDAEVYLQDVYVGPGLAGVPRGTIKRLRVIAYHFGFVGLAGNDKIGLSGPWDAMRIVGTTPVEEDGSATFRIPADTPVAFQALDEEGKAVQLMRTWFSARPGERVSCIGCHEAPETTPPMQITRAAGIPPRDLDPWYGPPRGFDFEREVQPVLNKHCVSCHDGRDAICDLRSETLVDDYEGRVPGRLDSIRMREEHRAMHDGKVRYTPAYEALVPYIRRVNVGDDVSLLTPGHYHADTSELIQMLQRKHGGVELDAEAWDRLVTWIDLNGPCHGTWTDVFQRPLPEASDSRRAELFALYGGPTEDPEWIAPTAAYDDTPATACPAPEHAPIALTGWPFDGAAKCERMHGEREMSIDLGDGVAIDFVKVPAGRFVIGDVAGLADEQPETVVTIAEPFWMSRCEISNEQFRRRRSSHDSGYYTKRHEFRYDDKGMTLNDPEQPAVRVSWDEATDFCRWLSEKTGREVALPTEAQWEYACRAGSDAPLHIGDLDADFGPFENMADRTFATYGFTGKSPTGHFEIEGGVCYLVAEGVDLAERRYDDRACVTAPIGGRRPNAFGLCDMHGNAAEWTRSSYAPYPYRDGDALDARSERVVRGGSFLDRPERCRSSARYAYPAWHKVHNVGFRVVIR